MSEQACMHRKGVKTMARLKEAEAIKMMEQAKTGEDMVRSWATQISAADMESLLEHWKLWIDKKPDIIESYAHRPLKEMMARDILDCKTRELLFIALFLAWESVGGVVEHCQKAKAAGAMQEEIMEVAAVVSLANQMRRALETSAMLSEGLSKATTLATR
jgi:alkylhydroperoxidase/carboxymuconolactone decarboxylase family protein YurZ